MNPAAPDVTQLRDRLHAVGQDHLLNFIDDADERQHAALLAQLAALDIERLPELVETYVNNAPAFDASKHDIAPPVSVSHADPSWDRAEARAAGERIIRAGQIAALTVAGGQGSRLGYDGPKGCFPGTPVSKKPLFRCLAEWILRARADHDVSIPWYIMTSPLNDTTTRAFFAEHHHFGLPERDVVFFQQGAMPAFDIRTGKVLLADKHTVAASPDGHGGTLKALHRSGCLDDMRARGIEHISYTQIDNPLARVIDPVFIGLHADPTRSSAHMSTKAITKTDPAEKVGVLCNVDADTAVIEYSDLPDHLANQRDPDGQLTYRAGSIAIHMIARAFVETLTATGDLDLPFHRAVKKMPCVDPRTGAPIEPAEPNAVKLEMFIFDALPKAERSFVYEVDRIDEFAPIKNADGKDSPASSAAIQTERAARWLEHAGAAVPRRADGAPDCTLELSPLTATTPDELDKARNLRDIEPGAHEAI